MTPADGWRTDEAPALAAAVESGSEHAIAAAIPAATDERGTVEDFRALPGRGVAGTVGPRRVEVGPPVLRRATGPCLRRSRPHAGLARPKLQTVVLVAVDGWCAAVAVADAVKDSAAEAVAALHQRGLRTVLPTGDNPTAAAEVAARVGIEDVGSPRCSPRARSMSSSN